MPYATRGPLRPLRRSHRPSPRRHIALILTLSAAVFGATACGRSNGAADSFTKNHAAQIASFEIVADQPQRLLVGVSDIDGNLVGFGNLKLEFAYLGTASEPVKKPKVSQSATASYLLVAGQQATKGELGPRTIPPSEGIGVYQATTTFDEPGFWEVRLSGLIDGKERKLLAGLEVVAEPILPTIGDAAPRTVNRLPGDPTVKPTAIDSRADESGAVPDPELHAGTIKAAIEARLPVLVVVTTPVYCQSRFCGPLTDVAQELAKRYNARMAFSHIEVWNDFDAEAVNREAAEWIVRDGAEIHEPWAFLVDRQGTIVKRWDNVTNEAELSAAIDDVLR